MLMNEIAIVMSLSILFEWILVGIVIFLGKFMLN